MAGRQETNETYVSEEELKREQEKGFSTESRIRALPAYEKPYKISDRVEPGLYLYVTRTSKAFRYDFVFEGKRRTYTIGRFPLLPLRVARHECRNLKQLISQGRNPALEKQQNREHAREEEKMLQEAREERQNTFARVAKEWRELKENTLRPNTQRRILGILNNHLIPALGSLPIREIKQDHLLGILNGLTDRKHYSQAEKVCQQIKTIFRYALGREYVEKDVAQNIEMFMHRPAETEKSRGFPAITQADQVAEMLQKLDSFVKSSPRHVSQVTLYAIQLFAYLPMRSEELLGLRWSEIDLEHATITKPVESMKNKRIFTLYLPTQAVCIFRKLEEMQNRKLVFQSTYVEGHVTAPTIKRAFSRAGIPSGEHSLHGWRKTFTTLCTEAGAPVELAERCVSHETDNPVRAVYNKATLEKPCRRLMQWYADMIDSLRAGKGMIDLDVGGLYKKD